MRKVGHIVSKASPSRHVAQNGCSIVLIKKGAKHTALAIAMAAALAFFNNSTCCAADITPVTKPGTYDFQGTYFDNYLIYLGYPHDNTLININSNTNDTLTIERSSDKEGGYWTIIYSGAYKDHHNYHTTATIKGKLNLNLNVVSSNRSRIPVIEHYWSYQTMTFSDDVAISLNMTYQHIGWSSWAIGYAVASQGGTINFEKKLTIPSIVFSQITRQGINNASAVICGLWSGEESTISVGGNTVIDRISSSGQNVKSLGLLTADNGSILAKGDVAIKNISTSGKSGESYGLRTDESGGSIVIKGNTTIDNISASGDNSYAAGIRADSGSITLEKGTVITNISAEDAYAVAAYNGSNVSLNASGNTEAQVKIDNDLIADGAKTEISANFLSADSSFSGLTRWNDKEDTAGTINLTFKNGATWTVPSDNTLHGTLTLDNGLIALGGTTASMTRSSNAEAVTLTVDKLIGSNGIFEMRVNKNESQELTDQLIIRQGTGAHRLRLASTGTEATRQSLTQLVQRNKGDATFSLEGGQVEMGVYRYNLASETNKDGAQIWKLVQAEESAPDNPTPTPAYSTSAKAVLALASLGAQTTQHLNNLSDLRKRLGDVRHDDGTGLWVQVAGQKDRLTGFAGQGFRQTSYRFNLGADQKIGDWILGANFKYVDSDQKLNGTTHGTGDSHSEGFNLYATYVAPSGLYADFVLSADKNHQHISTAMIDGTAVKGSYRNTGYGASAEVGYTWTANDAWGLFIEPQAELSYYKANGKNFSLTNGMTVSQGDYDSLTGRLGAVMGKTFKNAAGESIGSAAVRAGWKGDLSSDNSVTVNGLRFSDRLLKDRVYYGFDADLRLSKNLRFFGYVEREEGNNYTKEVEAGAGLKYVF